MSTKPQHRLAAVITCVMGCGHTQDATPPAAAASNIPEAPAQPLQTASREPEKTPEPGADYDAEPLAADEPPPVAGDSIESFMLEHFLIAVWARDSVVDGDLESLRVPLHALADYGYQSVAPGGWMSGVAQLQAAARLTAEARTLEAAASGVAAMGRVCGECHRALRAGPRTQRYEPERSAPKSDSFEGRMFRHAWAVERLWDGLTTPSDNAWIVGAAALSQAPSAPPQAAPVLPPPIVHTLDVVRQLGVKAARADTLAAREKVYGQLLLTCAQCHSAASEH
jgi:hypothetical protein